MIVSLISQKGGVGKSSLARLIAVEMARAGWKVLIADLDPAQATSTVWNTRRIAADIEPHIDVMPFKSVERAMRQSTNYDLALLDGPAHAERGGLTMAKHSDFILVPSSYSVEDLEPQVNAIFELEKNGVNSNKIRLALWSITGSKSEGEGVRQYLRKAGVTALSSEVGQRPSIRQAQTIGRAASETTHKTVNDSAYAMAKEISELISKGART